MTTPDTYTVRAPAPAPVRDRWFRSLAYAVSATRGGGVLFESTGSDPVPYVTVGPRSILDIARPFGDRSPPIVSASRPGNDREPPRCWTQSIRTIVAPLPRSIGGAYRSELARGSSPAGFELDPDSWLGVQTHWLRGRTGELWVARRFRLATLSASEHASRLVRAEASLAQDWAFRLGGSAECAPAPYRALVDWRARGVRSVPPEGWWLRAADTVVRTAGVSVVSPPEGPAEGDGHAVVFGASGAGKTTFLTHRAVRTIVAGGAVVAIDLHGDLAPAILARLPHAARPRVVCVDASDRPVPGLAALGAHEAYPDVAAAHVVAALKRLSPDGQEFHWGFRLERILDTFVRLAQESGGTLIDVYDLLTDPARREAYRLATRRPELARFLDEIAPIVRRQPDFLWSAATRLAKIVLVPALTELLAPADGGIPVDELLEAGRSILVRIPIAALGPEAATFAGSLVLGRIYLGRTARRREGDPSPLVSIVLDEAQAFAPRLLAEILNEGRKFGVRAWIATQYPDRLSPELRSAAAGTLSEFVAFRVPPPAAGEVGEWLGLAREDGERWLPELPVGHGARRAPGSGTASPVAAANLERAEAGETWGTAVSRTRTEFPVAQVVEWSRQSGDAAEERLLLAVMAAEEDGHPVAADAAIQAARGLPGPDLDAAELADRWGDLLHRRWVEVGPNGCRLATAGARWLGLTADTGATTESTEHRALLLATFRLFARRGYRIEIVRQGRFDTTLPDARFRQLSSGPHRPADLASELDRVRGWWAWRFFRGRDVHIEVEVSGAMRADRIRRGWRKASDRGAFALFVVGDAAKARRVRSVLRRLELGIDRAQVWTLALPGRRAPSTALPAPTNA